MNTLIQYAAQLRDLQVTPNPAAYEDLLRWIDQNGLEKLRKLLELQLISFTEATQFELSVQKLDDTPPLFYQVSSHNTIGDLKKQIADHEGVDVPTVGLMLVEPDVALLVRFPGEGHGEEHKIPFTVSGRCTGIRDDAELLVAYEGYQLTTFPNDGRITWTESMESEPADIFTGNIPIRGFPATGEITYVTMIPATTVRDLKKKLFIATEAPVHEQQIVLGFTEIGDDGNVYDILRDEDAQLSLVLKRYTIPYTVPNAVSSEITLSVLSRGTDAMEQIHDEGVSVGSIWGGPPGDVDRYNISQTPKVLYELNPDDTRIYVETLELPEE